jgi:hypothetical protein
MIADSVRLPEDAEVYPEHEGEQPEHETDATHRLRFGREPDLSWLEFLWELCELAARGEDIRERTFGPAPASDAVA